MTNPSQEFKNGEAYMLHKLKKYVSPGNCPDPIMLSTRLLNFIQKEEENERNNHRKSSAAHL